MTRSKPSPAIQQLVDQVGIANGPDPTTSDQVDIFGKLRDIEERIKHQRTIINVWKQQQDQDRQMRKRYANWLIGVMIVQVVAINISFVLIGLGLLKFEPWTVNTFVMATFAEISALVLLVVKYLFPTTTDRILDLIDRFKGRDG